jgi:hypothetical protein
MRRREHEDGPGRDHVVVDRTVCPLLNDNARGRDRGDRRGDVRGLAKNREYLADFVSSIGGCAAIRGRQGLVAAVDKTTVAKGQGMLDQHEVRGRADLSHRQQQDHGQANPAQQCAPGSSFDAMVSGRDSHVRAVVSLFCFAHRLHFPVMVTS